MSDVYGFLDAQNVIRARYGLQQALNSDVDPEKQAQYNHDARLVGAPLDQGANISPELKAKTQAEQIDWAANYASQTEYERRLGDMSFANLVKDDVTNTGFLESLWYWISGSPEKPEDDSLGKELRNSLARGGWDLANSMPIFGNIGKMRRLHQQLDHLDSIANRIKAGESDAQIFGTEQDPSGKMGRQAYDQNSGRERELAETALWRYAQAAARINRITSMYPDADVVQEFNKAKESAGSAVSEFMKHPLMNLAATVPSSAVQFAPAVPALGVAGLTGPVAPMALGGLYSYGLDNASTFAGGLGDLGIDARSPEQIYKFFRQAGNPEYSKLEEKAGKHAVPVAALDALSLGAARYVRLPMKAPAWTAKISPTAARVYESAFATPFRAKLNQLALQTNVQGAMGATGEALGQINAEGKVTSWSDVVAEFAGEFGTAPMEVGTMSVRALRDAQTETTKAAETAAAVQKLAAVAKAAKIMERDPQSAVEFLDAAVKDKPDEGAIYISADALHQDGLLEKLAEVSPSAREQIQSAVQTGDEIRIPYSEFVANVARSDIGEAVAEHAHVADMPSYHEAVEAERAIIQGTADQTAASFEMKPQEFRDEVSAVGKDVTEALKAANVPDAQAKSYSALVQTLVGNMASDAGMSPREIWEQYGIRNIFSEGKDVTRNASGQVQAVSPEAKSALTSSSTLSQLYQKEGLVPISPMPKWSLVETGKGANGETFRSVAVDGKTELTVLPSGVKGIKPLPVVLQEGSLKGEHIKKHEKELQAAGYENSLHAIIDASKNFTQIYEGNDGGLVLVRPLLQIQGGKIARTILQIQLFESQGVYRVGSAFITTRDSYLKSSSPLWDKTPTNRLLPADNQPVHPELTGPQQELNSNNKATLKSVKEQTPGSLSKGEYFPTARSILLWANADRSTFLHETGHWFLGARVGLALQLKNLETLTDSQKHLVSAVEDAVKWLGYDSLEAFAGASIEERRPAEERFARTFEQYLKDGRAPSAGLQSLFRRFANWLKAIYGFMTAVPGSQMSDDVRQMFDRLFVAEEQQTEARLRYDLYQALNREDFSEEKAYQAYLALMKESIDAANEDLTARGMRDMRYLSGLKDKILKNMTEQAKEIWRRLSDEEYDRYVQSKDYKNFQLLSEGEERDGKTYAPKISREEAKAAGLSDEALKTLDDAEMLASPKEIRKDDGRVIVPGEALAEQLGYSSLSELVEKMSAIRKPEEVAEQRARERMLNDYGEFSSEKRMKQAAAEAIFNPATARLLATEINYMEGNREDRRVSVSLFRDIADAQIGRTKMSDLRPEKARRTAAALSRESRKYQKGFARKKKKEDGTTTTENVPRDPKKAAELKRKELYQAVKAEEMQKKDQEIQKRIQKLRRRFSGKKDVSGIDGAYTEQIQRLLAQWGFSNGKAEGESYAEFAKHRRSDVGEVVPELTDDLAMAPGDLKERTVNQVEAQLDFLEDLASLGKRSHEIRVNGHLQSLDNAVNALAVEVSLNAKAHGLKEWDNTEREGRTSKVRDAINKIGLVHARIPSLLAAISGTRFGKMFDLVTAQVDRASSKKEMMQTAAAKRLAKAYAPLDKVTKDHKRVYHKIIDASVSRSEVLTMLLNLGTEANTQRLLDGSAFYSFNKTKKPWTYEQVATLIAETLTPDEIKAAQGVWDAVGMFGEQYRELQARTGNRPLKLREAVPVSIPMPDGETISLKGGYYPIAYDKKASHLSQSFLDANASLQEAAAQRLQPYTNQTHAKDIAAVVKEPLTLTARAGFEELDAVIHDICFREVVGDLSKIFSPKSKLTEEIKRYWGADAVDAIHTWIRDIAMDGRGQAKTMDALANILRSNVSLAGVGFNLMTAAIQPIGLVQTVAVLGPEWSAKGIGTFLAGPNRARKFAAEKSAMMANRMQTRFREVAEIQARAIGNVGSIGDRIQTTAYLPVLVAQMLVDIPTWIGAYNKALSEGNTDARAVAMADRVVVDAQGGGRLADLSGVERGDAWSKLFTVFYTFFNTAYNIGLVSRKTDTVLKAALNYLLVMVAQPVIETFVRAGLGAAVHGDDGDDEWLSKTLRKAGGNVVGFNLGTIVGLREISDTIGSMVGGENAFGYAGPAGTRKITDALRLAQQINQGEVDEAFVKSLITVIGEWSGIPPVPINRAISGKAALERGETDNPLVLILGYSKN